MESKGLFFFISTDDLDFMELACDPSGGFSPVSVIGLGSIKVTPTILSL